MARNDNRVAGVSTPPEQTYMDHIQNEVQETGEGPHGESMFVNASAQDASDPKNSQAAQPEQEGRHEAQVNDDALQIIEPDDFEKPIQVENPLVVFMPKKTFQARINQQSWDFQKDVPKHVPRELANMLEEDDSRGYVRD